MRGLTGRARACALIALTTSLAGCGAVTGAVGDLTRSDFSKKDAVEITRAAEADMFEVTSMRVTGSVISNGQPVFLDLRVAEGGLCSGSLRVSSGNADVRQNADGSWLRSDSAMLRSSGRRLSPGQLDALEDKWVEVDEGNPMCDLETWLKGFKVRKDGTDIDGRTMKVGDEVSLDGVSAVEIITVRTGEIDDVAYVASESPHHVLKMEAEEPSRRANIAFADFNEELEVQAPPAKDTVGG